MSLDYKRHDLEIWQHEKTGNYFIVHREQNRCAGPYPRHRIWREYWVATEEPEPVLATANFWEVFDIRDLAYPASEFLVLEDEWIPSSITIYDAGKLERVYREALAVDWLITSQIAYPRDDLQQLISEAELLPQWNDSSFGLLTSQWKGHPEGCGVMRPNDNGCEAFAIIDTAPAHTWCS